MNDETFASPSRSNAASPWSWRLGLTLASGLSVPCFFAAIVVWLMVNSHAPWWALAFGAALGFGCGGFCGNRTARNPSRKISPWVGGVAVALLLFTQRIIFDAIPLHPTPSAFTFGYVAAFVVGVAVGTALFLLPSAYRCA